MSMYDRRLQPEDRTINGYTTNSRSGLHSSNNDNDISASNSSSMNNHYYNQCSQSPQLSSSSSLISSQQNSTMATLCNIGNTCYLNSVVYTLRFAPMFLHKLHHLIDDLLNIQQNIGKYHLKSSSLGRNISGLHMENTRSWSSKDLASLENISCDIPKSNQQIATEKLHELYQNLHRNECTESTEPFHADKFLHAIQEVSAIFEGNQQQDAHEFLMCVLDSIRQTCQSLIKSISECPDVVINGCISLPEQKETQCAFNAKEKSLQRDTTGSSAILKTSFFSRKSKRKDIEVKTSKHNMFGSNSSGGNNGSNNSQSPHKDNNTQQILSANGGNINNTLNNDKVDSLISETNLLSVKDNKERLSDKIKKLGLDFFSEDFEGITVSTTKCLSCETITEQKETMIDIPVPITNYENINLGEKFIQDSCVTKEYFCGENKYRCEQCMGYTEAIRSISYEILPRLLIIQLNRFSGVMEKINTYLPTPFTLQCFCSKCLIISSTSSSSSTSQENKNLHLYKLYSVITHVGATMSVGHYIAYTCSLDWANDYINCPKDRIRQAQLLKQKQAASTTNIGNNGVNNTNNICNGPTEKNIKSMKKIIFGRNKASSSGDMSKTVKTINGLSNKSSSTTNSSNNVDKYNTTCPSINCCGLLLKNNYLMNNNSTSGGSSIINNSSGYLIDFDENNHHHHHSHHQKNPLSSSSTSTSGYNSNNYNSSSNNSNINNSVSSAGGGVSINSGYSGNSNCSQSNLHTNKNEPIWYMCDDDKIKAMSQREFEEILSPNRKIMITPYLLFYARSDVK